MNTINDSRAWKPVVFRQWAIEACSQARLRDYQRPGDEEGQMRRIRFVAGPPLRRITVC